MENIVHSVNRPAGNAWHECVFCHKLYTKRTNLKRHVKSQHQKLTFNCPYCESTFKRKDYLSRHIRTIHIEVSSPSTSTEPCFTTANTASQTKKCKLAKAVKVCHFGTSTERTSLKDQSVNTDQPETATTVERACSPIQWGNLERPRTAQSPSHLAEYFTASSPAEWDPTDFNNHLLVDSDSTDAVQISQPSPPEVAEPVTETHYTYVVDFDSLFNI